MTWERAGLSILPSIMLPTRKNGHFHLTTHSAYQTDRIASDEKETFFVLVEQGAFLKTIDDGASFIDLTGYARPEDANYRDPHRLIIDKDDTQKMWLCSGVGLYRTDDGGTTYAHLMKRGERIGYCDFAFIDPRDSQTIYQGGSALSPNDWLKWSLSFLRYEKRR